MPNELTALGERERNSLLRQVDWRFLLHLAERPRALNLADGRLGRAVALVTDAAKAGAERADLVVVDRPSRVQLRQAHEALRPGGALYCEWRRPIPAHPWWIRRALRRAGFEALAVVWPGPRSGAITPEFWLPLDCAAAAAHLLAGRPARGRRDAVIRGVWRLAESAGALAPLGVVARRGGDTGAPTQADELAGLLDRLQERPLRSWLLLTGGHRSINKVVGLPFDHGSGAPQLVVKFARVPESEPAVLHEAAVLRALADRHDELPDVPRVLAVGRRAGRSALAETAVHGAPLMSSLTPQTFPHLAAEITRWLVSLAGCRETRAPSDWWERLVHEPLQTFEHQFGSVLDSDLLERAGRRLAAIGPLPIVFEHRDCAPWNIVLTPRGAPALLDWESAEPAGLPALDLVYFLANAAFVLEGALESGRTRQSYQHLLGTATGSGRVAADCMNHYCVSLNLDPASLPALRLLTWVVHARSDFRHLELEPGRTPPAAALRRSACLGLVQEELRCEAG